MELDITPARRTIPAAIDRYFRSENGYEPYAVGLFIRGQWERIALPDPRPITRDWAAGAMAAGATAVLVSWGGSREADFQLSELV